MLDAIPAVVFVAEDAACSSIYGNAAAEALLRAPRNANFSKSAIDAPTPQTFDVFDTDGVLIPIDQLPMQRAARGVIVADAQWEVRFADGEGIFMQGAASPLRDESGAVWGAIGVYTDISSGKKQERRLRSEIAAGRRLRDALQASEERYRELAKSAPAMLWVADANGGSINHDDKWRAYTGMTQEQGLGAGWVDPIHPDDVQRISQRWHESLATGADYADEHRIRRGSDGAYRGHRVEAKLRRDAQGRTLGWFGSCVDIEESKQAEATQRESNRLFRTIYENAGCGISMAEPFSNGVLLRTNDRFCEMLGYGPGELAGRTFTELTHPDDRQLNAEHVRAILAGEISTFTIEKRYLRRDGSPLWGKLSTSLMRDPEGKPTFFIGSMVDISDLKRAEQALRVSEERFRILIEAKAQVVFETDPDGELIGDLPGWRRFSGQQPEDWSGRGWAESIHPDDRAGTISAWRAALSSGNTHHHEHRLRGADGAELWVSVTAAPVRGSDGEILKWVGMITDITARKEAEEKLRLSEERLRLAMDGAHAAAWQLNIKTGVLIGAPECFVMHGLAPHESGSTHHETWANSLHPDDRQPTERLLSQLIATQTPEYRAEYRILLPSGDIRWLAARGTIEFAADGTPLRLSGINLDITKQKRAEQRLAESEARFRAAQEASLDGFLIYEPIKDKNGQISDLKVVYANPIGAKACRYTPEQMEGRLIGDLLPGSKAPGGLVERTRRIVESGASEEFVLEFDSDGVTGYFRNLVVPFGRYTATTFRDVTQSMQDAEALEQAKAEAERANFAKSKFLAAASHDLRQPVQSLTLLLSVIKVQVKEMPKTAGVVEKAKSAIDSLNGLLTGILDISKLDAGVVTPDLARVNLGEIIDRLVKEYAPRAAIEGLTLRHVPSALWARTDTVLMGRILRNLMENALRYTEKGGILIGLRLRGDKVRLDVIDTGIGIPADKQTEIFEEFRQLNNPARNASRGLGLGLAIVSRLARLLGTPVEVSSRVGHGARFSLLIPIDRTELLAMAPAPAFEAAGGRILVIEDDERVRESYEMLLSVSGYEVISAETGEEALALAAKENWRFDAVLADHRLGAGLTGTATAMEISRQAGRAIPTVVVTGDTAPERLTEVSASGFALLHKPTDGDELCASLASLIRLGPRRLED